MEERCRDPYYCCHLHGQTEGARGCGCTCHEYIRMHYIIDEANRARAEAEAREAVMREALQRIDDTDTHGRNVIVDGRERPTGDDFCGRCHRNSFHPHADDCPVARARRILATPSPVATALVELERAAREVDEKIAEMLKYDGFASWIEVWDWIGALSVALHPTVTNLDRARGGGG